MWHSGSSTPVAPLALQSLDHSQLYQRRTHQMGDGNDPRTEEIDNLSPSTGDYEDLSEQDWADAENSLSSISISSGQMSYAKPTRPTFLKLSSTNTPALFPTRSVSETSSPLYMHENSSNSRITGNMSLGNMFCSRCNDGFEPHEKIVNSNGELWHTQCFVCAQCFRPFPDGTFYEFEGRKYCEHDFHVLFAPCCGKCGEFVIGRVIKAMNANWHPRCFRCESCSKELADLGFIRNQGRALCHECNAQEKAVGLGKYICHKCHGVIDEKPLRFRGEVYHPYHFNCASCKVELNSDAREVKSRPGFTSNEMNELYCLRCHDKMGIPICGACRRPIEERVVTALGKHWHVEHFVCAKCEKPFLGHRHYEKKGLAYCETHYHQLFGNLCFVCNQVIAGDVFTALNKAWCVHHFACSVCDQKMNQKTKFYECDLKPVCKKCYDKYPAEVRRRLRKTHEATPKKATV
ncbi:hypothetical protein FOCC_FOCC009117 [Frankliniella occidentalis]|uniref:LIM and senescent cell antigen-like-containing domain protein 1 isoform X1 n=2 Tax=Frankliniella occidentalis TaxID=133901 RepID=A0A6J1RXV0_FRAOC|nr:LIM and senescent cell antigen-like-containing domain protein 1 isoform X1 [Frankliniella occidentalis]KAE8744197.1 hypothetical protein FOCC_FOCC009117 [Frankliniella occidentalis]